MDVLWAWMPEICQSEEPGHSRKSLVRPRVLRVNTALEATNNNNDNKTLLSFHAFAD